MKNLEIIHLLMESTFIDEDDAQYQLQFQEPLADAEIEKLKLRFPNNHIDPEIIEILRKTRGWDGFGPEMVYFDSITEFGFTELAPQSLTLGHDGAGNFLILDIHNDGSLGKVFFACHDPAVLVVHSQNLNEYLHHLLEFYQNPITCHFNEVQTETVTAIWEKPNLGSSKDAFLTENPTFRDYLNQFEGNECTIADLRDGKNKDGFAWGKFGPNQLTDRHPTELIWVIKNKKKGFLSSLFG